MMRLLMMGLLTAATVLTSAAAAFAEDSINTLSDAERQAGWQLLFDGTDPSQWRNYKKDTISDGFPQCGGTRSSRNA